MFHLISNVSYFRISAFIYRKYSWRVFAKNNFNHPRIMMLRKTYYPRSVRFVSTTTRTTKLPENRIFESALHRYRNAINTDKNYFITDDNGTSRGWSAAPRLLVFLLESFSIDLSRNTGESFVASIPRDESRGSIVPRSRRANGRHGSRAKRTERSFGFEEEPIPRKTRLKVEREDSTRRLHSVFHPRLASLFARGIRGNNSKTPIRARSKRSPRTRPAFTVAERSRNGYSCVHSVNRKIDSSKPRDETFLFVQSAEVTAEISVGSTFGELLLIISSKGPIRREASKQRRFLPRHGETRIGRIRGNKDTRTKRGKNKIPPRLFPSFITVRFGIAGSGEPREKQIEGNPTCVNRFGSHKIS